LLERFKAQERAFREGARFFYAHENTRKGGFARMGGGSKEFWRTVIEAAGGVVRLRCGGSESPPESKLFINPSGGLDILSAFFLIIADHPLIVRVDFR
jgi:hypothetical protein